MSIPGPTGKAVTTRVGKVEFVLDERYRIIKKIGAGAFGCVVSAEDKISGRKVAIKKISNGFEDPQDAKRILREIRLMRNFNHENIVGLYDIQRPPTLAEFNDVYIISDLMDTDLHRIIYSSQPLTDEHVQYFIYQLLRALKYMHSADVLHRDLKPSNILLMANCDLKICDFGLARMMEDNLTMSEYVVTRWYRAPEIMLACPKYTKAVDVWSLGCIFAELLMRRPLFPGEDYIDQLKRIVRKLGSPDISELHFITEPKALEFMKRQTGYPKRPFKEIFKGPPAALDLLEKMLQFDPERRISIEEALEHPYVASLHVPEDEPSFGSSIDFSFEEKKVDKETMKTLIYQEMCYFHPEAASELPPKLRPKFEEKDVDM